MTPNLYWIVLFSGIIINLCGGYATPLVLPHKAIYEVKLLKTDDPDIAEVYGQVEMEFLDLPDGHVFNESWHLFLYYKGDSDSDKDVIDPLDDGGEDAARSDETSIPLDEQPTAENISYSIASWQRGLQYYLEAKKTYPNSHALQIRGGTDASGKALHIQGFHDTRVSHPDPICSQIQLMHKIVHCARTKCTKIRENLFFDPKQYFFEADWESIPVKFYKVTAFISATHTKNQSIKIAHPLIQSNRHFFAQCGFYQNPTDSESISDEPMEPDLELSFEFLEEGIITKMECPFPGQDHLKLQLTLTKVIVYDGKGPE